MTPAARFAVVVGAILGGLSVAGGAFGAHALRATLEASGQAVNWETAARYAMVHALALVATGLLILHWPQSRGLAATAWCFLTGTAIFSGCLAALALTRLTWLGAIVPIGGVLLIAGWGTLAATVATRRG